MADGAGLERLADRAQDCLDYPAKEEQGHDSRDRDQCQDEGVLGKPLSALSRCKHSYPPRKR